jgi:hypothetical protein
MNETFSLPLCAVLEGIPSLQEVVAISAKIVTAYNLIISILALSAFKLTILFGM